MRDLIESRVQANQPVEGEKNRSNSSNRIRHTEKMSICPVRSINSSIAYTTEMECRRKSDEDGQNRRVALEGTIADESLAEVIERVRVKLEPTDCHRLAIIERLACAITPPALYVPLARSI